MKTAITVVFKWATTAGYEDEESAVLKIWR